MHAFPFTLKKKENPKITAYQMLLKYSWLLSWHHIETLDYAMMLNVHVKIQKYLNDLCGPTHKDTVIWPNFKYEHKCYFDFFIRILDSEYQVHLKGCC